jgi:hypothetical protein
MNSKLEKFARASLIEDLAMCTDKQESMFRRMYSKGNLELPLEEVVANLSTEKLDWAMTQVRNTLDDSECFAVDYVGK